MILVITSAATRSEINTAINKVIAKCEYSIIIPQDMDTEKRITKALKSLNAEVLFQISFSENFRNFVTTKNVTYLDLATCTRHFSDFNKAQYDFIMNLESCSVNALAGTGKTYAITYAAVNLIVKCKCTVEQLCFVTFTREATKEINNRFSKVLEAYGQICNNKVIRDALCNNGSKKAFTIDSLFFQILKEVGTDIGISKNIKIRNDDRDIDKIISDVVEAEFGRERAQKLRPVGKHAHNHYLLVDSGFFAKDFISFIKGILYNSSFDYYSFRYSNDFKRNNIFDNVELNLKGEVVRDSNVGNILNKLVKECILRITSLTEERILRDQTISLKAVQFYLLMCKDKFKECDFIQKLKYLFIDENQDCSPIQLHLINEIKLANRDCKFVHIGDGNQAIYSFRMGKSSAMEAVSYLPGIQFKYNYRCSKKILNAANYICTEIRRDFAKKAILKEYKNPAAIQLIPSPVAINGVVRVIPSNFEGFLNGNNGVTAVVREILSTNKDTTINNNNGSSDDEKIFILSRDNARCGEIHKKLKEDSFIKVTNKSIMLPKYGSLFTSQPANDLLALLKYREKRTDINNAINLINSGFGFFDQEITSEVIINIAREDKNKIFKIADIIYEASEEIISKQENVVTNIKMLFESLPNKYINNNDYISNIKLILNELSILAKDKTGNFGNVINFINYNAVKREIKTKEEREFNSQIIILTQHSAKGLERANVIAYIDQYINFEYKQLTYGKNEDNKRTKTKIDIIFTGDLVDGDVKSNKFDFSLERLNPKGEYCSVYTKNFTNSFRSRAETQFFEEVNLLYITMTRAKKTLTLYVNNSKNNLGEYIWRLYSRNLK